MKKKILSLILVVCLFAAMTTPIASAVNPTFTGYFDDVKTTDWFSTEVEWAFKNDLMNGVGNDKFNPGGTTTRGMIVTILWRMDNEPTAIGGEDFSDVNDGDYFQDAVAWANEEGIVTGYGSGKFGPNDPITREQLAAILYRYADYRGKDVSARSNLNDFADEGSISSYAREALSWANAEGLITGVNSTTLSPKGRATRAQVAVILYRFDRKIIGTKLDVLAPVVQAMKHEHAFNTIVPNNDKTHSIKCLCGQSKTEDCEFAWVANENNDTAGTVPGHRYVCKVCGAVDTEKTEATPNCNTDAVTSNGYGTHSAACDKCGYSNSGREACTYGRFAPVEGKEIHSRACSVCKHNETEDCVLSFSNNLDGTHTAVCAGCGRVDIEEHNYSKQMECEDCGAVLPVATIGKTEYETLLDAVEDADEGDTIVLHREDKSGSEIEINKNLTIEGEETTKLQKPSFKGSFIIKENVELNLMNFVLYSEADTGAVRLDAEGCRLYCDKMDFSVSKIAINASYKDDTEIEVEYSVFFGGEHAIKTCSNASVTHTTFSEHSHCALHFEGNTQEVTVIFEDNLIANKEGGKYGVYLNDVNEILHLSCRNTLPYDEDANIIKMWYHNCEEDRVNCNNIDSHLDYLLHDELYVSANP